MRRKRRNTNDEINLTPLLDVLFCILFIVMLSGAQSQINMQAEVDAAENKSAETVSGMQARIDELEEQVASYQIQEETNQIYKDEVVLVTITNTASSSGHRLNFYVGNSSETYATFVMGVDKVNYTHERIEKIIDDIAKDNNNKPIYIVFNMDSSNIYRIEEYLPIQAELERAMKKYKEVFYKIVEVEDEQ